MASPAHSATMDPNSTAEGNIRKRVCKACDRCRLKKSKCDGANACSRCKADNAICVFGERKKSHDKVYPKGYVEMLEQQQTQLVAGLRELYRRLQSGEGWPGEPLLEAQAGHPLTHDILERLDLLHVPGENGATTTGPDTVFEDDTSRMQQRLLEKGAGYHIRRGSVSSDSDHGHPSPSSHGASPRPSSYQMNEAFSLHRAPPTPPTHSPPYPEQSQLHMAKQAPPQLHQQLSAAAPTGVTTSPFMPAPSTMRTGLDPSYLMRPSWSTDSTAMVTETTNMDYMNQFDTTMNYDEPMSSSFEPFMMPAASASLAMPDWNDAGELDFSNYINPITT